jgi:hypothetical protein
MYPLPTQLKVASDAMNKYWYALSKEGAETSKENCFAKHVHKVEEAEGLKMKEISGLTGNLSMSVLALF